MRGSTVKLAWGAVSVEWIDSVSGVRKPDLPPET